MCFIVREPHCGFNRIINGYNYYGCIFLYGSEVWGIHDNHEQ